MWPEKPTEFMPGFVDACAPCTTPGIRLIIASARLNRRPLDGEGARSLVRVRESQYMRHMLDQHGLTFIDIWTKPGKPGGSVYVDDKGERYGGRPGSWRAVTEKILMRLGKEEPVFPAFPHRSVGGDGPRPTGVPLATRPAGDPP
jgi:hypothetical protein